jgi:hypothetical protein
MTSTKCNFEDIHLIFDKTANELVNTSLSDEERILSFHTKLKELETNPRFEYCKDKLNHVSFKLIQDSEKVKNLVKDVINSGSEKVTKFLNSRGIDLTKPISITKSVSDSESPIIEEIKPIDYARSILPTFPDMKEGLEAIIIFLEKLDKNKSGYIDRMSNNKMNNLGRNKMSNIKPEEAAVVANVAAAEANVAANAAVANAAVANAAAAEANAAVTQGGRRRKTRRQQRRQRRQRKQQKKTRKH